jgi:hypothetical protein
LGSSDERSFTITNTGNARLTGTVTESCAEFSLVGGGDYDLAPTEAATFGVRFAPTSGGIKSCTFDNGGLCANVGVSGTGQAPQADPQCAVSTDSLLFGTVAVGQSATRTFTITNTGGGTLSGTVSESCASFTIVGTTTYFAWRWPVRDVHREVSPRRAKASELARSTRAADVIL